MHEWSLIQALLERVALEARAKGATAVHEVRVSIGEVCGVDPDLFLRAYHDFRPGTLCADAPLEVSRPAARWKCPSCARFIDRGEPLRCAACGLPARLAQGDEILLERIELEVS